MAIEKIAIDRKSLKATEKELTEISSQIKQLNKEKLDFKMNMKNVRETSVEIEEINMQLKDLNSRQAVINTDTRNVNETNMQLIQLNETIQHMESSEISLDVSVDFGNVAGDLENIGNTIREQSTKFIEETAKAIETGASALQTIDEKVSGDMDSMLPKFANMGIAIAGMGALAGIAGQFAAENPQAAAAGFAAISEISKLLEEAATSLKEVGDRVPTDVGSIVAKLGSIGVAVGGMGALVAVAGALSSGHEKEAKAGFQTIRDICILLEEAAVPLQSVGDKVPTDLGSMASKLGSMGIAIVGMGALVGIAGVFADKASGIAEKGMNMILDISILLQEAAETMGMVADKIPADLGAMTARLASMGIAILGMGVLVGIAGVFADKASGIAEKGMNMILDISILLQEAAETMGMVADKIPADLGAMTARLASMGIAILGMGVLVGIAGVFADKASGVAEKGMNMILDISILLQEVAETMGMIAEKIPSDLGAMTARLASMGIAILGMGVLVGIAGVFAEQASGVAEKGMSMILDISILLQEVAETMQMIAEKIPSDLGAMTARLASMGIAILGMGVLVGIAGVFAEQASGVAEKGMNMILDISILLQEVAETMQMIADRIPSDLGAMTARLASMGIAILGMGVLVGIAGVFADKASGVAEKGLSMILDISILLQEAAETMGIIAAKVPSDLGAMAAKLGSMGIAIVGMGALVAIAGALATKFSKQAQSGLEMIGEINKLLLGAAIAMEQINKKVPSDLESMALKLASMGIAIVGMGALVAIVGKFTESNPLAAIAGLIVIGEIIGLLMDSAEAMKQIDEKVPGNIEQVAEKLAAIGIAIGGMSAIVAAVGALIATGVGALIAGAGLATVAAVAAEMIHTSEAIREMDQNVPDDMSGVKDKIESIAEAIGYFTEANLGSVLDLLKNAVGALNTAVAAEGIKKLVEVGEELQKFDDITVPANIETKINEIQAVFGYLQKGVGVIGEINKFFNGGDVDTGIGDKASTAITNLVTVAESLNALQGAEVKDMGAVGDQISSIQSVFGDLSQTKGLKDDMKRAFDGGNIDTGLAQKAKTYVTTLVEIGKSFELLEGQDIDTGQVGEKIGEIQDVFSIFLTKGSIVERLSAVFGKGGIDTGLASKAKTYVGHLAAISEEFLKIQNASIRFDEVKEKLQKIQDAIKELEVVDFSMELNSDTLQATVDKVGLITQLIGHLQTALGFTFDASELDKFKMSIENIRKAIAAISSADLTPKDEDGKDVKTDDWTGSEMSNVVQQAMDKLSQINLMGTELKTALEFKFDVKDSLDNFQQTIDIINGAISRVLETVFIPEGEWSTWEEIKEPIESAVSKLKKLNEMGDALAKSLEFKFDDKSLTTFQDTINKLNAAIGIVNKAKFDGYPSDFVGPKPASQENQESSEDSKSGDITAIFSETKDKIEKLTTLSQKIADIPSLNSEELAAKILLLQNCLSQIRTFIANEKELGDVEQFATVITDFAGMATKLNEEILPQLTSFGTNFATGLMAKYKEIKPKETIEADFTSIKETLEGYVETFKTIGDDYTKNLTESLISAIGNISESMKSTVDKLNATGEGSISSTFSSAGQTLGKAFVDGFVLGIEELGTKVKNNLENIGFSVRVSSSAGGDGSGTDNFATGGLVGSTSHIPLSGIFQRKGTDTVPAMLTPGEFVQRRSAVGAFGVEFMKRVNNLDVPGAFRAMTSRFGVQGLSPAVSTVVNNINHTTNNANRVTQNVMGGNADYIMKRAGRYLR